MGLDMYAYSVPAGITPDMEEWGETVKAEITYWRKFNALHGWMEDLYFSRGGEGVFNCVPLRLYADDLHHLMEAARKNELTPRAGFFWGSLVVDPDDLKSVEDFVKAARAEITAGRDVYYDSWW